MKLSVFLLTVIAALATTSTHATDCSTALVDAVNIPEQEKCETESGFRFIPLMIPTDTVKTKFCKSDACLTIWKAAKSAAPEECLIKDKQLYAEILDPLDAACKKNTTATSTSDKNATSKADDSHDHNAHGSSHGTGKKNKTRHGSGSMDSSDNDRVVKAPSNSTTKPSNAPNSGVSPLSLTAGVAFVSLAAASFL